MKKRLITALLVATGVFGAVIGLAASLGVTSDQLGSGSATVSSCDTTVNTSFGYDGDGGIDEVTVEGIQDGSALLNSGACDGETVYVELLDTNGAIIGTATGSAVNTGDAVDSANDSVTVTLGGAAPAASVEEARVTITG
jgi:hypothetical protein